MDKKFIEESIIIILKKELRSTEKEKFGSFSCTLTVKGKLIKYNMIYKLDSLPLLVSDRTKEKISSDTLDALISLYQRALSEGITKGNFLRTFLKVIGKIPRYQIVTLMYFCLLFFVRIKDVGSFSKTRDKLLANAKSPISEVWKSLMMISQIIRYEYEFLEEKDISTLKEIGDTIKTRTSTSQSEGFSNDVLRALVPFPHVYREREDARRNAVSKISALIDIQIAELQYRSLKRKLADINPVINVDKQRTLKILYELGFNTKFHNALNSIEDYFRRGELDKQEAAICISKIGSFIQDFNQELIRRIEQIKGENFTGNIESVASTIQYLKQKSIGFFDNKIADVYKSIYDLCSATGRHHLVSEKEDARICKNIMIELVLLVSEKLQKYTSEQKKISKRTS